MVKYLLAARYWQKICCWHLYKMPQTEGIRNAHSYPNQQQWHELRDRLRTVMSHTVHKEHHLNQNWSCLWLFHFHRHKNTKAVVQRCPVKKVFLEIWQSSQENTCARVSFLIKLQAFNKKHLFHRAPLVAASKNIKKTSSPKVETVHWIWIYGFYQLTRLLQKAIQMFRNKRHNAFTCANFEKCSGMYSFEDEISFKDWWNITHKSLIFIHVKHINAGSSWLIFARRMKFFTNTDVYLKPTQTSTMKLFAKIVNDLYPWTISPKKLSSGKWSDLGHSFKGSR